MSQLPAQSLTHRGAFLFTSLPFPLLFEMSIISGLLMF